MNGTKADGPVSTSYVVYGVILAIAVAQVVVAMTVGPSLTRMLILAAIQAYLAVMYFMHLRYERPSLRLTLIPIALFVLVMMNMIWPDSFRLIHMRPFPK
jgi:heme/copper-type cytochrome/quinol oxidase subunit 4